LICTILIAVVAFSTDQFAGQAPIMSDEKAWTMRVGEPQEFESFLKDWTAKRIHPLDAKVVDSVDREYLIDQRSNELIALTIELGFYADIIAVAHPHGGVNSYVRYLYQIDSDRPTR